jgi:hypothetical protein
MVGERPPHLATDCRVGDLLRDAAHDECDHPSEVDGPDLGTPIRRPGD